MCISAAVVNNSLRSNYSSNDHTPTPTTTNFL